MASSRTQVKLALILSEMFYIYPFYYLLSKGLELLPILSMWFFPIAAITFTVTNIVLAKGKHRYITIAGINLLIFALEISLAAGGVNEALFLQGNNYGNTVLLYIFLSWVTYRSIYIAWRQKIDLYVHFDISLTLLFFCYFIAGLANFHLPGGMIWLLAAFFINIAKLYLAQTKEKSRISWLVIIGLLSILLFLAFTADSVFPLLIEPARFVYGVGSPIVDWILRILIFLLIGFTRLTNMAPINESPSGGTSSTSAYGSAYANPSQFGLLETVLFWLGLIFVYILLLLMLFYFLRTILAWLFRTRAGKSDSKAYDPGFLQSIWKTLVYSLLLIINRVYILILPWLPIKLDIFQAYQGLLRWGAYKKYPRRLDETPYEYLYRLKKQFPQYQKELQTITDYFVLNQYGPEALHESSKKDVKIQLSKLYIPHYTWKLAKPGNPPDGFY